MPLISKENVPWCTDLTFNLMWHQFRSYGWCWTHSLCAFQDSDFFLKTPDLNSAVGIAIGFNSSHLQSVQSQVIFRWWKISLRSEYRSTKPGETKETHEDFLEKSHLQVQIALIFGSRILDCVFNLCEGKFDFLERLSDSLLLNIISYLDLEDIARLSQTSRRFAKVTNYFVSL